MSFVLLVRVWIWGSVLASVAGWVLSALGQLNAAGYAVACLVGIAGLWIGREALGLTSTRAPFNFKKLRARFRRGLPACFAVLAFLVLLGGALYPPTNHTAMTYRTPRVLHWLAEGHWYWIHTPNYRMNNRCCGFEWLTAPLLLFTKTDRCLSLTFSVWMRLEVRTPWRA
jgi:peptidoglycan/LPS O-acetylase OafA/YrhL